MKNNLLPPPAVKIKFSAAEIENLRPKQSVEKIILTRLHQTYPGMRFNFEKNSLPLSLNELEHSGLETLVELVISKIIVFLNEEISGLYWCVDNNRCWGYGKNNLAYLIREEPDGWHVKRQLKSFSGSEDHRQHLVADCLMLLERNLTNYDNIYYPEFIRAQTAAEADYAKMLNKDNELIWNFTNNNSKLYATARGYDYIIRTAGIPGEPRIITIDKRNLYQSSRVIENYRVNLPTVAAAAQLCAQDLVKASSAVHPPPLEVI